MLFFFYGPRTEYTSSFTYGKWLNVPLLFTDCKMIENSLKRLRDLGLDMDSLLVCLRTLVCSQLPSIATIKSDTVLTYHNIWFFLSPFSLSFPSIYEPPGCLELPSLPPPPPNTWLCCRCPWCYDFEAPITLTSLCQFVYF